MALTPVLVLHMLLLPLNLLRLRDIGRERRRAAGASSAAAARH